MKKLLFNHHGAGSWPKSLGPLAVLALLWALFHGRVLFGDRTFVLLDSSAFFFPLWTWGAKVWAGGSIPLWNPDAGFGTPYLADPQMAAWYPPLRLLFWLLKPVTAFNALVAGHHLLALSGFFILALSRGASPWSCAACGLLGGFSFSAVSLLGVPAMGLAYAWLPWVLWAAGRLLRDGKSFLAFSMLLAAQLSAGYPLFSYLTLLLVVLERLTGPSLPGVSPGKWLLFFLGCAVAGLFNAAWAIPSAEFLALSSLPDRMASSSATPWGALATFLDPFRLGHPLRSYGENPHLFTVYFLGLPPLAALLWGAWKGRVPLRSWVPLAICLLLSLGEEAFLGDWLRAVLPGYSLVVRSGYWIPFVAAAVLLPLLEAWRGSFPEGKDEDGRLAWTVCGSLVYLAALILGVPWELPSLWLSYLFLVAMGWNRVSPRIRPFLFFLSLVFSLGPVARSLNFTMERSFYETPPSAGLPGLRLYHSPESLQGMRWMSGGSLREAYQGAKEQLRPNLPLAFRAQEIPYANALVLKSYLRWYLFSGQVPRATGPKVLGYFGAQCRGEEGSWAPCPGALTLNKWFSVVEALPGRDWQECLKWVVDPGFQFSRACVVAESDRAGSFRTREVRELHRDNQHLELEARGQGKGLLVSSESAYPGWRAFTGEKELPLWEVNYGFRGILLEEGQERVRLDYRPSSFRLGCFLSLLALGFWASQLLLVFRGRRHA